MAIMLEFMSLIIPIENIDKVYEGGFKEYLKSERHNSTAMAWYDKHLYRKGWGGDSQLIDDEIQFWEDLGLTPAIKTSRGKKWKDLAVLSSGPWGGYMGVHTDYILPGWIETNGTVAIKRGKFIGMIYPNDDLESYNLPTEKGEEGERALKLEKESDAVLIFREYGGHYERINASTEKEVIQGLLELGYTSEESLHPLKPQTKWKKDGYTYYIQLNKFDEDYPDRFYVVFATKAKKNKIRLNKTNTKKLGLEKQKVVSNLIHYVQPYDIKLEGRYPMDLDIKDDKEPQ